MTMSCGCVLFESHLGWWFDCTPAVLDMSVGVDLVHISVGLDALRHDE